MTVTRINSGDLVILLGAEEEDGRFGDPTVTSTPSAKWTPLNLINHSDGREAGGRETSALRVDRFTAPPGGPFTRVTFQVSKSSSPLRDYMGAAVWVFRNSSGPGNMESRFAATEPVRLNASTSSEVVWGVFIPAERLRRVRAGRITPTPSRFIISTDSHWSVYIANLARAIRSPDSYGVTGTASGDRFDEFAVEVKR